MQVFRGSEGGCGDFSEVHGGVDVFEVNAYCAVAAERDEDDAGGVGDIEGEVGVGELGFFVGAGDEGDCLRLKVGSSGEENAESAASEDELVAGARELAAIGAGEFFGSEAGEAAVEEAG